MNSDDIFYNTVIQGAFKYSEITPGEKNSILDFANHVGKEKIYEYVKKRKVIPFVANLMMNLRIDEDFWQNHYNYYKNRNTYFLEILTKVFDSLARHGVKKIFVYENFGALLASGQDVSLFASGDIDMYADNSERINIGKAFEECGFVQKKQPPSSGFLSSVYFNDSLRYPFCLSVMWQPLLRNKLPFEMDINNSVNWACLTLYKDTNIALPPKDALMYLCALHISVHSYSRSPDIRLYIDLNNAAALNPDYYKIMDYAKTDMNVIRVVTALLICKRLTECAIPEWIFDLPEKQKRKVRKLLELVYDEKNNLLRYEPSGIKLFVIEFLSDNNNLITGLLSMIFPKRKWIKSYYLENSGNLFAGYIKHIRNLVGA